MKSMKLGGYLLAMTQESTKRIKRRNSSSNLIVLQILDIFVAKNSSQIASKVLPFFYNNSSRFIMIIIVKGNTFPLTLPPLWGTHA